MFIYEKIKHVIKKMPGGEALRRYLKKESSYSTYEIRSIKTIKPMPSANSPLRISLLITSMNKPDVFAGIKTAVDFFINLADYIHADKRILVMGGLCDKNQLFMSETFHYSECSCDIENNVVVNMGDRNKAIPVGENDIFIATMWDTAYSIYEMSKWYEETYKKPFRLIYLIQDFEPGFYPWSSRYILSESTYHMFNNVIAVFNSFSLQEYFKLMNYTFEHEYAFTPRLNSHLRDILLKKCENPDLKRKKQILIYGRPSRARNAFELIAMALDEWYQKNPNAKEWIILSAGQNMPDISCPSGAVIRNVGKLSMEEYANVMFETSVGISLMVSPHPSYPPLEMAAFGVSVITNQFANKDLASFNENIISLERCTVFDLVNALEKLTSKESEHNIVVNSYLEDSEVQWRKIYDGIKKDLN